MTAAVDVYAKAGFLRVELGGQVSLCAADAAAGRRAPTRVPAATC